MLCSSNLEVSRAELVGYADLGVGLGLGRDKQLGKERENFGLDPLKC